MSSIGSLNAIQENLASLPSNLDLSRMDIWQYFLSDLLKLDNSFVLDNSLFLDPSQDGSEFSHHDAYVDCLVFKGHDFIPSTQDSINDIRYLGRRVISREILELYKDSPRSIVYQTTEFFLDNSFLLDASLSLNPHNTDFDINEIRIGNGANGSLPSPSDTDLFNPIYSNQNLKELVRSEDLVFLESDISDFQQEYDEIGFFSSGILIYKITFSQKRNFQFTNKIVRLNTNGASSDSLKLWNGSNNWDDSISWNSIN